MFYMPITSSKAQIATPGFTKMYDELVKLGLSKTLVLLYGRVRFRVARKYDVTHQTLAAEVGIKSREHLHRLLKQLRRLRLIEWKRGRYFNTYTVFDPDVTFLSRQMRHKSHISNAPDVTSKCGSDLTGKSHLYKEVLKERRKKGEPSSSASVVEGSQPSEGDRDDAAPFPQSKNPNPEAEMLIRKFAQMLQISRAQTVEIPVAQVEQPDREITIQILEVFASFEDATAWVESTVLRALARKAKSPRWALWLTDARNMEQQVRLDRQAEEANPRKAPQRQKSVIERLDDLWRERIARGERPI
jgi:hypothetical protein